MATSAAVVRVGRVVAANFGDAAGAPVLEHVPSVNGDCGTTDDCAAIGYRVSTSVSGAAGSGAAVVTGIRVTLAAVMSARPASEGAADGVAGCAAARGANWSATSGVALDLELVSLKAAETDDDSEDVRFGKSAAAARDCGVAARATAAGDTNPSTSGVVMTDWLAAFFEVVAWKDGSLDAPTVEVALDTAPLSSTA